MSKTLVQMTAEIIQSQISSKQMSTDEIKNALNFLKEKQNEDGNFNLKITRGSDKDLNYWICLAVCRLFKRYSALG